MPSWKSVRVQCLRCGHFNVLTPEMLSRLAVSPTTPIATFVKRLRCRECGSQSVLATRKPPPPISVADDEALITCGSQLSEGFLKKNAGIDRNLHSADDPICP